MRVSPSAVAQWESGDTKPKMTTRADLARVLSVHFLDLLPESAEVGDGLLVRGKEEQALVQMFRRLPEQVRSTTLALLAAILDELNSR